MQRRLGLRAYLGIAFAAIALATGAAFAVLTSQAVGTAMQSRIADSYLRLALAAGHSIDDDARDRAHDVHVMATFLRGADAASLRGQGESVAEALRMSGACAATLIADRDGTVIASSKGGPAPGAAIGNEKWFAAARVQPVIVESEDAEQGGDRPIWLAEPIQAALGSMPGLIACAVPVEWIAGAGLRFVSELRNVPAFVLYVVGPGGRIVAGPTGGASDGLPAEARDPAAHVPETRPDLAWPDGHHYLTVVAGLGSAPESHLDWRVVVRSDSSVAFAPVARMYEEVFAFGVGLAVVAALLGLLAAHVVLSPLRRITDAARRVGGGEFGVLIPSSGPYREIGVLGDAIRTMVASLRGNEARLAALNEDLDQRVRQRTAEIAEAHAALEREESRMRAIIETAMDGVLIIDDRGRVEIFNRACERIFGWRASDIVGRPAGDLLAADQREVREGKGGAEAAAAALIENGQLPGEVRTVRGRRRDGTTFPLEMSLSRASTQSGAVQIAIVRDVTEAVRAREQLFALATQDSLTGMRNRRYFLEGAETEFARSRRHGRGFSLLLIDADHFKRINDTHGHEAGDRALKALARVCQRSLREVDLVGRLGGEEFGVAMPETDLATARIVAERLRQQVAEQEVTWSGGSLRFTVSIGVAAALASDRSLEQMLRRSDQALYAAKGAGRNRVELAAGEGESGPATGPRPRG